jgi:hypothetical protein
MDYNGNLFLFNGIVVTIDHIFNEANDKNDSIEITSAKLKLKS